MDGNQSSRTAETMAIHRAAEAMLPEDQRVCYDPLAVHFLSQRVRDRFKSPIRRTIARWLMNYFYPGVNGAVVARVRFMDDQLEASIQRGLEQLVILGAGFDTRPYRFNIPDTGLRVFEVDQSKIQQMKIKKLTSILAEIPSQVTFVPVDLEREKLEDELLGSGYDAKKKTLFILEGLVMYLPRAVVEEILNFIANRTGKGSAVLFDYLPESMVDGSVQEREGRSMRRYVMKNGEPFRFGMNAVQMDQLLSERGFVHVTNQPATQYKDAYFKGDNRNRKISRIFSFVYASKGND